MTARNSIKQKKARNSTKAISAETAPSKKKAPAFNTLRNYHTGIRASSYIYHTWHATTYIKYKLPYTRKVKKGIIYQISEFYLFSQDIVREIHFIYKEAKQVHAWPATDAAAWTKVPAN